MRKNQTQISPNLERKRKKRKKRRKKAILKRSKITNEIKEKEILAKQDQLNEYEKKSAADKHVPYDHSTQEEIVVSYSNKK